MWPWQCCEDRLYVVTVYWPDEELWDDDYGKEVKMTEICPCCGGKTHAGYMETEYRLENNSIQIAKQVPADICDICDICGKALLVPDTVERIDEIIEKYRAGTLAVKPLMAGEVALESNA